MEDPFLSSLDLLNKSIANAAQVLSQHPFKYQVFQLPANVNEQLMKQWGISECDYANDQNSNRPPPFFVLGVGYVNYPPPPFYALGIGNTNKEQAEKNKRAITKGQIIIFVNYDWMPLDRDGWEEFSEGIQHETAEARMLLASQIPEMLRWYEALLSESSNEAYKFCKDIDDGMNHLRMAMEANTAKLTEKQTAVAKPKAPYELCKDIDDGMNRLRMALEASWLRSKPQ